MITDRSAHDGSTTAITHDLFALASDLELESKGHRIVKFFDTSDVQPALLGMREYITSVEPEDGINIDDIASEKYEQPAALVSALLASGQLGKFSMLAPHQAELGNRISKWADFRNYSVDKEIILRQSFLDLVVRRPRKQKLSKLRGATELEQFVREHIGIGDLLFRAFHSVSHTWWEQLQHWQKIGLLVLEPPAASFVKLAAHEKFRDIENYFQDIKSRSARAGSTKLSKNCFADSMSVFLLRNMVNSGGERQRVIPRFFDSTGNFREAVRAVGIDEDLMVKPIDSRHPTSALVGPWYFLARVAFQQIRMAENQKGVTPNAARDLFATLSDVVIGNSTPSNEIDRCNFLRAKPLGNALHEILNLSFFEQVWLPELAKKELQEFASRLDISRKMIKERRFTSTFERIVDKSSSELRKSAKEYSRLSTIWYNLRHGLESLAKRLHRTMEIQGGNLDPIRDLDLIRFFLSDGAKSFVTDFVNAVKECSDDPQAVTSQNAWRVLVECYYSARDDEESAIRTVAVLWAMGAHDLIRANLETKSGNHNSVLLDVFYAASCFTAGNEPGPPEAVLDALQRRFERLTSPIKREPAAIFGAASLASQIGYVAFHCARMRELTVDKNGMGKGGQEVESRKHRLLAIRYVERAISLLDSAEIADNQSVGVATLDAYVTNQLLYYLLSRRSIEYNIRMKVLFERMVEIEETLRDVVWQWQYDDTLSRYHEYQSSLTDDVELRIKQMAASLMRIEKAHAFVPVGVSLIERERLVVRQHAHIIDELTLLKNGAIVQKDSPSESTSDVGDK